MFDRPAGAPWCFCSNSQFLEASLHFDEATDVSCIGMVTQACSAWESSTFLEQTPSNGLHFKIVVNIKSFLRLMRKNVNVHEGNL